MHIVAFDGRESPSPRESWCENKGELSEIELNLI